LSVTKGAKGKRFRVTGQPSRIPIEDVERVSDKPRRPGTIRLRDPHASSVISPRMIRDSTKFMC